MRRHFGHNPSYDCIHCCKCRTRVALVDDYILTVPAYVPGGLFNRLFNVVVADDVRYYQQLDGNTLVNTNCVQCGLLLGWELIAVPQPSMYIREGRFYVRLHKLSFWDDVPLFRLDANVEIDDEHLDANEENDDQDGDANEENDDQDRVSNEQDLGANEQNADQDGVTNETGS